MTTEERLQKLERQCRIAKNINVVLMAVVFVIFVGLIWALVKTPRNAQPPATADQKTIRANEFILEDTEGKPRATLAMDKGGPTLSLLDENKKGRVVLGVYNDGPELSLYDERENVRALLFVPKEGAMLDLIDENNKPRITVRARSKTTPQFWSEEPIVPHESMEWLGGYHAGSICVSVPGVPPIGGASR